MESIMKRCSTACLLIGLTWTLFLQDRQSTAAATRVLNTSEDRQQKPVGKPTHIGVWKPTSGFLGGNKLPDAFLKAMTLKLTAQNYEVRVQGQEEADKGTYTVNGSTKPQRMTIKGTSGPNKGKTLLAIFEFQDKDTMRICYDVSGKAFPKTFAAPEGSQHFLLKYRRQKPKQNSKPKTP